MPTPPFLLGLSAGASVAVIARVVAQSSKDSKAQSRDHTGVTLGRDPATKQKRESMTVRPNPFQRVPPSEWPTDPCVECEGSGRAECPECRGRGRTNMIDRAMLPKTVWPEWCTYCRGSGKINCHRCQGMGNYRQKLGFDMDDNE